MRRCVWLMEGLGIVVLSGAEIEAQGHQGLVSDPKP